MHGRITAPRPTLEDARVVLQRVWGYPDFRYHQRKAILAAISGRDCLAVMPTGGGKSLCFQVPALCLPTLTVVVSPLISLMQDQVAALRGRGVAAAYLSSTQKPAVQAAVWRAVRNSELKLLYLAPERLGQLACPGAAPPLSLVAVDEAHCISEWGHDFRPHFRALGGHVKALGRPPILALTATATPETRHDVVRVLGLRRPVGILQSFDRPNLRFAATRFDREPQRLAALYDRLRTHREGSTVVYVPTRNRTDGVAALLRRRGFSAAPYHAGLPGSARRALLERFLDGRIQIIVATSAFGMGIDKPDVRLVAHLGLPSRPEAYFQEAGRAGRDGKPARCELLWCPGDVTLAARLARRSSAAPAGGKAHRKACRRGFDTMRRYLVTRRCRRRLLLAYLGERLRNGSGCARCDRWGVGRGGAGGGPLGNRESSLTCIPMGRDSAIGERPQRCF